MRAIIYTRVSADATGLGRSVSEQEADCRAVCEREGWSVAEVLTDNDIGASRWSRKDRPEYRRLRQVLQSGDVLVMWEASRAQRDMDAYLELRELCASRGVLWSYSGKTYDLSRGDDRFTTGLDALLSERESEMTRERVMRTMRANLAAGKPHGKVPYGYQRAVDRSGKPSDQIIHPEQAAVLREAARRVLAGESARSICRDFIERGLPSPGKSEWYPSSLQRLLRSPTIAGLRVHKGKAVGVGTWEPIITEETHLALCAHFALRGPVTRGVEPKYLLTGIATCGVCGSPVYHSRPRGVDTYQCKKNYCVARVMHRVDGLVERAMIGWLELGGLSNGSAVEDREGAVAEVKALRARLDGFMDAAASGELSPNALAVMESKLQPQIAAAELRAFKPDGRDVTRLSGPKAAEHWGRLPVQDRRELVRERMIVTLLPAGRQGPRFRNETVRVEWR